MSERRHKVDNLLALAVLAYLTRQPMHPYQLSRMLRDFGDARSIKFTHGSLYMVVQQLARAGLIREQETTRQGQRPERTVYALTPEGREEFRQWLRQLVEVPHYEYPRFVAALSLIAALPPDEVVELLRKRLRNLEQQREHTRTLVDSTLATGVHPLFQIEEEYRIAMLEGEARFVEQFIERITDPKNGWGRMWAEFSARSAAR